MMKIIRREQEILVIFLKKGELRSSNIHAEILKLGEKISLVTVKRALTAMTDKGLIISKASGRSTSYSIGIMGRLFAEVDAHTYCSMEPDKRYGQTGYNFNLLPEMPSNIFTDEEQQILGDATTQYEQGIKDLPVAIQKKELERLIIELSWKSSKIEGNTYTLLDTERLILQNKKAPGKSSKEAQMILNHKDAFNFVYKHAEQFKNVTRKNLEQLHAILAKNLGINKNLRKKPVGVIGSIYKPLDNVFQIGEAVDELGTTVSRMSTPYAKALCALLGISYIQPFDDGNKRTSRLMANALLLAHGLTPLSYRSVNEVEYREAMLVFYELNSIVQFKKIFVAQYAFAAQHYAVK